MSSASRSLHATEMHLTTVTLPGIWRLLAVSGAALWYSACLCWFVPCDREYDVTGWVRSANVQPLGGAQASMSWDAKPTATDACRLLLPPWLVRGTGFRAHGRTGGLQVHTLDSVHWGGTRWR